MRTLCENKITMGTQGCFIEVKGKLWFLKAFPPSIFPAFYDSSSLHIPVDWAKSSECSQEKTAKRLTYLGLAEYVAETDYLFPLFLFFLAIQLDDIPQLAPLQLDVFT